MLPCGFAFLYRCFLIRGSFFGSRGFFFRLCGFSFFGGSFFRCGLFTRTFFGRGVRLSILGLYDTGRRGDNAFGLVKTDVENFNKVVDRGRGERFDILDAFFSKAFRLRCRNDLQGPRSERLRPKPSSCPSAGRFPSSELLR